MLHWYLFKLKQKYKNDVKAQFDTFQETLVITLKGQYADLLEDTNPYLFDLFF